MMVWIVLSLAFSLCMGLYLAAPFFERQGALADAAAATAESTRRLLDSKERALRALKDLELDFTMGKVSREDYDRSHAELSLEVGRILQELRSHE
jgi:hypothetical protein